VTTPGPTSGLDPAREPWPLVAVLSVTEVISWGTLYYTPTVLASHIEADTGWRLPLVLGGYSAGILVSGLAAPFVGRWIDAAGGRRVMAAGSALAVVALLLMAWSTSVAGYYAAWGVMGLAMAATLYEAAFATLNQHFPVHYRRALTALTLLSGLASTIFWPVTYALAGARGWRATLVIFAALHAAVCLPLHAWGIPRAGDWRQRLAAAAGVAAPPITPPRRRVVVLLASAFALNSLVTTGVLTRITGLLEATGLTAAQAVGLAALLGPMQVTGRILEFVFATRLTAVRLGLLALCALPLALLVLALGGGGLATAVLFVMLLGLSNGVMTIVRGIVPATLFGRERLATVLGLLAAPTLGARAAAPLVIAFLVASFAGPRGVLLILAALAATAIVAFLASASQARTPTA